MSGQLRKSNEALQPYERFMGAANAYKLHHEIKTALAASVRQAEQFTGE